MPQTTNRKHRGLIIRPRDARWQVDFGTHQGKRKQFSYDTIQEAKSAVDLHLDDRRLETIDRRNRRVAVHDRSHSTEWLEAGKRSLCYGRHSRLQQADHAALGN